MAIDNTGMSLATDNDNEGGWSGTDGPSSEVFQQGSAAESMIVSKTATETATLTLSLNMSGSKYFNFAPLSTIAPFYNTIKIQMQTDVSNYEEFLLADRTVSALTYRAIGGMFKYSMVALEFSQGVTTGIYNRASHTALDIEIDNSTSGNIRSVENHYFDAMWHGNGRQINGTTLLDRLFRESNDYDISADRFDCCTLSFHGKIFAQTDVQINTTLGNSYNEGLVFMYVPNTSNLYEVLVNGTAYLINTVIEAEEGALISIDTSGATSFNMIGGGCTNGNILTFALGQDIKGGVFNTVDTINQNGSNFENYTVNACGTVNVLGTGTFTNNKLDKPTGITGVNCVDLGHILDNEFISNGAGYAVTLTDEITVTASMSCNINTIGYTAGVASGEGVDISLTPTGDEDILVNVASGQILRINVADNSTTPSVANSGLGEVYVIAGQVTMTLTGHEIGCQLMVYDLNSADPQDLGDELFRTNNATASEQYQYSGGKAGDDVQVKALADGFRTFTEPTILGSNDSTYDTTMTQETN